MTFFWCKFGFEKCFETSFWSNHWAGCQWLLYKICFSLHVTIWSRNGSLLLHRIKRWHFKTTVFLIFGQLMRHPLVEIFHLSICFKCWMTIEWLTLSSLATSCVVVRASASMIALIWLLSTSNGWPLGFSSFIFVFFAKLLQPLFPYTFVSSSWAKCVVYVASCLCCFMTILNSNKKITWICFLSNIISIV